MWLFKRSKQNTLTTDRFWSLMETNIEAALKYFDEKWGASPDACPQAIRVAYHLHRWLLDGGEEHVRKIEAIAQAEPPNSQLTRAYHIVKRQQFERQLAQAIWKREARETLPPPPRTTSKIAQTLDSLGLALVESLQVYHGEEQRQQGFLVLKHLPPKRQIPSSLIHIYDHLFIWANWSQNQQDVLIANRGLLEKMKVADPERFLLTAAYRAGRTAALNGQSNAVAQAIATTQSLTGAKDIITSMVLSWGMETLENAAGGTLLAWSDLPEVGAAVNADKQAQRTFDLMVICDLFRNGQIVTGREKLEAVTDHRDRQALGYLDTLSLLASAASTLMMWSPLRAQLIKSSRALVEADDESAWRGDLLLGLIAYADGNSVPRESALNSFRRAIEQVPEATTREHLRAIETVLLTRARAVENATEYIANRNCGKLRDLQDNVLAPLGDTIPPLIRIAVYLMLWESDAVYDPIPDLQRIPYTEETSAWIDRAILQVLFYQVVQTLTTLCRTPQSTDVPLPAVTALKESTVALALGQLATSLIHLTRAEWEQVRGVDVDALPEMAQFEPFIRFYAAWQMADIKTSSALMHEYHDNPYMSQYATLIDNLQSKRFLTGLEQRQTSVVRDEIWSNKLVGDNATREGFLRWMLNLAAWLLISRRTQGVETLIEVLRNNLAELPFDALEMTWALDVLSGMAAAQRNKYTLSAEAFDRALDYAGSVPPDYTMLATWSRLARLEAELGRAARATDDLDLQWPSIYRTIVTQINQLPTQPITVLGYGHLIAGMIRYLTSSALVDDEMINSLKTAQRLLPLSKREAFLNEVISKLQWRKDVIMEFWNAFREGDFQIARTIYNKQIQVLLGDSVPPSMRFAVIVVEWRTGNAVAEELERQLAFFVQQYPQFQTQVERLRAQIAVEERMIRLTRTIRQGDYESVIGQIDTAQASPPEQLALLLAYLKKQRLEDAESTLAQTNGVTAEWQSNFRHLLAGYITFQKREYEQAAEHFSHIRSDEVAGKNRRAYWALARFQRGMELLKAGKQNEALDQILAYLRETNARANIDLTLARTLIYFGRQNLKQQNGNYALEAFTKATELTEQADGRDVGAFELHVVASIGKLVTQSKLRGKDMVPVTDEDFHALTDKIEGSPLYKTHHHIGLVVTTTKAMIVQTIIQEVEIASTKKHTQKSMDLLCAKLENNLDNLDAMIQGKDPLSILLRALIYAKLTTPPKLTEALQALQDVMTKFGMQSRKVSELAEVLKDMAETKQKLEDKVLSLLDQYLYSDVLRDRHIVAWLAEDDALQGVYSLNRQVTPRDLPSLPTHDEAATMKKRIEHMREWVNTVDLPDMKAVTEKLQQTEQKLNTYIEAYRQLLEAEASILTVITNSFRDQGNRKKHQQIHASILSLIDEHYQPKP